MRCLLIAGTAAFLGTLSLPGLAAETKKPAATRESPRVTLDYVNGEISDVVRALSAQSRINVAVNPSVKGKITINLRQKPVDEALNVVANLAGVAVKKVNDTFVLAPRNEMRQTLERLGVTRTASLTYLSPKAAADLAQGAFPDLTARPQGAEVALIGAPEDIDAAEALLKRSDILDPSSIRVTEKVAVKYRQPSQVVAALTKMVPGVKVEPAGAGVVLNGTKADVESARSSIELMDVPPQVESETRVYQIRHAPADQLVTLLERAAPDIQVALGPESDTIGPVYFNPLSGQFIGNGSGAGGGGAGGGQSGAGGQGGAQAASAGQGKKNLKQPLTLVLKGAPAALDAAFSVLGMVDTPPRQVNIEARVVETNPEVAEDYGLKWSWSSFSAHEVPPGTTLSDNMPTRRLAFGSFSRVPWNFQAILTAMITKRDAKLLASPQISVLNDQEASIFIGDTLRFQSLATSSPITGTQFTVVEVPVGIILLVHPRVSPDGTIRLRVHPVVSTVSGFVDGIPQTSSREADTTVRVKDGDTLVIGGLIRDEDVREVSKIPILGDLPLVGQLFRSNFRNHRRTEVMIFLTIKLVE